MRKFLFTLIFLIGFGLNAQAQQTVAGTTPQIIVLGNVVNAKRLVLIESLTLTQAIGQSGGVRIKRAYFFSKAKTEARIYRIIEGTKDREEIRIDFGKILKGKAQDIALKPYDIIEVACPKKRCGSGLRDMEFLFGKDSFLID